MEWLFRAFFGLIGACVLIALAVKLKNLCAKEHTCRAVVREREQKRFPLSVGSARRDRTEYSLTFFLPEQNRTVRFDVSEALFQQCPAGTVGLLTYRGSWLRSFRTEKGAGMEFEA